MNRQRSDINMKQTKLFLSFFQFNLNMFIHSVMLMWNSNESIQSIFKLKNLFKLPKSSNLNDLMKVTKSLIQLFFLKNLNCLVSPTQNQSHRIWINKKLYHEIITWTCITCRCSVMYAHVSIPLGDGNYISGWMTF